MLAPDLIARHRIVLHDLAGSTRWVSQGANAWFGGVPIRDLEEAVSAAFDIATKHLSSNATARGLTVKQEIIEAAALRTIIGVFYLHRVNGEPLALTSDDLSTTTAKRECAAVCKEAFGDSYSSRAAALLGMTERAFLAWEEGERNYARNVRS